MSNLETSKRSCGECDVCCRGWLKIDTDEFKVPVGEQCPHLSDIGCGIYETRAVNPCRTFFCGWASTDSPLPDRMQPHISKAIVLFNAITWQGHSFDKVIPVGEEIPRDTIQWLMAFFKSKNRNAVFAKNEMLFNGKISGRANLMIFAPEPLKSQIQTWCDAGNSLLD